jgi:hypothetical protein
VISAKRHGSGGEDATCVGSTTVAGTGVLVGCGALVGGTGVSVGIGVFVGGIGVFVGTGVFVSVGGAVMEGRSVGTIRAVGAESVVAWIVGAVVAAISAIGVYAVVEAVAPELGRTVMPQALRSRATSIGRTIKNSVRMSAS